MSKDGIETNQGGDAEFEEFAAADEVEVGDSGAEAEKPAGRRPPREPKQEEKPDDEESEGGDEDEEEGDEDEEEQEEKPEKKKRQPSDRIRELSRRNREKDALIERLLAREENRGLPNNAGDGNSEVKELPAPDSRDTEKYPLGHLDDRYIEDKLEWLADQKAADRADAALLRQQEREDQIAAQARQEELLGKVDDLSKSGEELFDDFQETVVETGMRGEWKLSQATFEAAHEAENGAQILYDLSQDKKEALRVSKLSPYQQLKFVQERDTEITKAKVGRRIPKAGAPPEHKARGASSRTQGNPSTDNLDDFEKQWEREAKSRR